MESSKTVLAQPEVAFEEWSQLQVTHGKTVDCVVVPQYVDAGADTELTEDYAADIVNRFYLVLQLRFAQLGKARGWSSHFGPNPNFLSEELHQRYEHVRGRIADGQNDLSRMLRLLLGETSGKQMLDLRTTLDQRSEALLGHKDVIFEATRLLQTAHKETALPCARIFKGEFSRREFPNLQLEIDLGLEEVERCLGKLRKLADQQQAAAN